MVARLMGLAVLAAGGFAVYKSLPDIQRYLKIRQM
ncbi:MAG: DUF6893 family small protein [Acidimicrobiales bacterium]